MDLLTFQQMTILQPPPLGPEHITLISSGTSQLQLTTIKKASFQRVTNDDIKEGMAEQGVTGVRRITVRRDGTLKPTNTFVLTFNSLTYLQLLK